MGSTYLQKKYGRYLLLMMFNLLYTIGIRVYYLGLWIASFGHIKAKKFMEGRKSIPQDTEHLRNSSRPCIWIHCASVGEFEQAYPLIQLLRNEYQGYIYHISFFSPSGYDYAKKKYPSESISYLPFDTPIHIDYFVRRLQPKLVILVKYEFWYNLLSYLHQNQIPVVSVSSIFRANQLYFAWYGKPYQRILSKINHFFVQQEESANLLISIGIKQVTVSGDTRFDRVLENSLTPFSDSILESFVSSFKVFVAGSAWNSDIPALKTILQKLGSDWRIIIAPHEIGHFDTQWLEENCSFYTKYTPSNSRVLILDTIGLLSKVYRFADLSYVGGGFDKGLHNVLEPIVYGKPVLIGPKFQKFNEVVNLVKLGCVFPFDEKVSNPHLEEAIQQNGPLLDEIKTKIEAYMASNANVSEKIAVYLRRSKLL
jgi:3-deoxy-D-manno-octulosonic-acid transferase